MLLSNGRAAPSEQAASYTWLNTKGQIIDTRAEAFIAHSTHTQSLPRPLLSAANSSWHKLDTHAHTAHRAPQTQVAPRTKSSMCTAQRDGSSSTTIVAWLLATGLNSALHGSSPGQQGGLGVMRFRGAQIKKQNSGSVTDLITAKAPKTGVACKECPTSQLRDAATNLPATINRQSAAPTRSKTRRIPEAADDGSLPVL